MDTDVVKGAVNESISGIMSQVRAGARSRGIVTATILHTVSLAEVQQRTYSRLQGIDPDADLPTLDDIRAHLASLGVRVMGDSMELRVQLPPPRPAHAR